ncbi:MAG: precorrin-6Y C5,15-methyltransferase (decarboxylating) subunit CbiT [Selenomonadaceae bacterium]|nr:precorrin-6Y C5,15-methyltransferase (decarboxylating) subunit CbiT [Selenomonadaceae bacterium]
MHCVGIGEEDFIRGKVPITKKEIRILALAQARIAPDALVADVGAGTGSLTIEAALLAPRGKVYALERSPEALALIAANAEKFGANNVTIIPGEAPATMGALPPCDAVFVGGSGGKLAEILGVAMEKLKPTGRLVALCITLQSLTGCFAFLRSRAYLAHEAVQVQVNRLAETGGYDMMQAQNPIWLITMWKSNKPPNL